MKIKEMQEVLEIISSVKGSDSWPIAAAEHDIIMFSIDEDDIPIDSKLGIRLEELGLHYAEDHGCWSIFC